MRNSKFIANFGLHQVYPKYIRMLQRMLFLIVLVLSGCDDQPGSGGSQSDAIRQAAEFEPVEAVWMLWSLYDHKRGYSNERVTLDIIRALLPHTRVKLIFPTDSIRDQKIGLLPVEALKSTRLEILVLPYMEFWARDMGPAFILRNNRLAIDGAE